MKQSIFKINFICFFVLGFSFMQSASAADSNFKEYSNSDFSLQLPNKFKGPRVQSYHVPTVEKSAHVYTWGIGTDSYANIIKIKTVPFNSAAASQGFIDAQFMFGHKNIKSRICSKIFSDPGITNKKLGKYNAKNISLICQIGDYLARINMYGILANNNAYIIEVDNLSKKNGFNQKSYGQVLKGASTISLKK